MARLLLKYQTAYRGSERPKNVSNEQAIPGTHQPEKDAANQEDFPETLTDRETDSSDLETELPDDGYDDLKKK
jgi:hypothetical protein